MTSPNVAWGEVILGQNKKFGTLTTILEKFGIVLFLGHSLCGIPNDLGSLL